MIQLEKAKALSSEQSKTLLMIYIDEALQRLNK
jgi:hypothetical protein